MNIHDALTGLEEEVNGTIIGDVTFPYQFWTVGEEYGNHCIVKNYFTDDDAACGEFIPHGCEPWAPDDSSDDDTHAYMPRN